MHVGVAVPQSWGEPAQSIAQLRSFVLAAEDGGLDSLWVQEQLIGVDASFEPLGTLAYVAALTSRVRLASAGFVAPLRPALGLAKALATVDQFSLGRLDAGFVLGEMPAAFDAGNVDWSSRGRRLEDTIAVLRSLWADPTTNHDSPFGRYRDVVITPKPVQPGGPPIWIGAKGGAAIDRVARLADGWIGAGGSSLEQWRESLRELRERCEVRSRTGLRIGKKLYLWIDDRSDRAFEGLSAWFRAHWSRTEGEELARTVGVWGSPERICDVVAELAAEGADTVVLNPVGDERRQLDLICERVLPQLNPSGDGDRGRREASDRT